MIERSRALWNREQLALESDEVLAQLLDQGEMETWRELYRMARSDVALRRRIKAITTRVELPLPRFWLAALASLGEDIDWAAPVRRRFGAGRIRRALWVAASDLDAWADSREAQADLPRVVRRLIHATMPLPRRVAFPAGEGVQTAGWDGLVEVESGNAWVPTGSSGWEISVDSRPQGKASDDYEKRKRRPDPLDPPDAAFVFVTARRWRGKSKWAQAHADERFWREVRAYDADDLEQWLERAPAVQLWVARLLARAPSGAVDVEGWWDEWAAETAPLVMPPDLLLAGRKEAVARVVEWLAGPPSVLPLRASSRDEAVAFVIAASSRTDDAARASFRARCVIASDMQAWRELAQGYDGLILIPRFEDLSGIAAAGRRHHVLIPVGPDALPSSEIIDLPLLDPEEATAALGPVLGEMEARKRLRAAGRSLSALRRGFLAFVGSRRPVWAKDGNARDLIAPLLAGAWSEDVAGDRSALARLATQSYDTVADAATRWLNVEDPPVRRVGSVWKMTSRDDGWAMLAGSLQKRDLDALEAVSKDVFRASDPRYDLPSDERWLSRNESQGAEFSGHIRQGLAETLALLATRTNARDTPGVLRPKDHVDRIVHALFDTSDWKRWATIASLLPILVEASPDQVLEATE